MDKSLSLRESRTSALCFFAGLFLICMCGLMLQILETRLLSVISWYNMAFFAISIAMFGMTAGSLIVHFNPERFTAEKVFEQLSWICVAFSFAVVGSVLLLITTAIVTLSEPVQILLVWFKTIIVLVPPYVLAGMAISIALTRTKLPIGLVYFVDLAGAAAGCLVALGLMSLVDGVSALFAVGAIAASASAFFALARPDRSGPTGAKRFALLYSTPIALLLAYLAASNAYRQPHGFAPIVVKDTIENTMPDAQAWNSFSRVRAEPVAVKGAAMWGPSPRMPEQKLAQSYLKIDGSAGTVIYNFDGNFKNLDFLRYDITNLAYRIRNDGRSAVIGVGGGRDMLSAHLFGFSDVTGVELNPIFVNWLTDRYRPFNRLADVPGTHFNVDEARSWFARTDERFDLIEMSLVDTWAATAAGAYSHSENGLYTVEGWKHFLDALTPNGVFTVSRWYDRTNVGETGRLLSLAMAALRAHGVADVRPNIYLASSSQLATLIASVAPLTADDLARLHAATQDLGFTELVSPDRDPGPGPIGDILRSNSIADLKTITGRYHIDVTPPTDDRPFFFNQLVLTDLASLFLAQSSDKGVLSGNFFADETIALITALSFALVLATTILPSLRTVRKTSARLATLGTLYFALIGLGFMFVEIAVIQRVSVFLGHPVYGLSIGLFSMILSTGLGSLASEGFRLDTPVRLVGWAALLALLLAGLGLWFPLVVHVAEGGSLFVRASIALAATVPAGFLMGFGFPTGMRIVSQIDRSPAPWFWSINGACSVLAASIATGTSVTFSINVSLWIGACCYVALAPVAVWLARAGNTAAEPARQYREAAATS